MCTLVHVHMPLTCSSRSGSDELRPIVTHMCTRTSHMCTWADRHSQATFPAGDDRPQLVRARASHRARLRRRMGRASELADAGLGAAVRGGGTHRVQRQRDARGAGQRAGAPRRRLHHVPLGLHLGRRLRGPVRSPRTCSSAFWPAPPVGSARSFKTPWAIHGAPRRCCVESTFKRAGCP